MIEGLQIDTLSSHQEYRGEIYTLWCKANSYQKGVEFVQDKVSWSYKNVLRGLHGDAKTWKLISCLFGDIYFVVVDGRIGSKTFGNIDTFLLSGRNRKQVLVPPGCFNGHLTLTKKSVFWYKWSEYYLGADKQVTLKWDAAIGSTVVNFIDWPKDPILSSKDKFGCQWREAVRRINAQD